MEDCEILLQTKTRKTVLVYCEGPEDKAFVKYLHDLFHMTQTDPRVNIIAGRGGTADGVVSDACKIYGEYNSRIVVIDNDKQQKEMITARLLAKSNKLILIEHTPCIERLLLEILDCKELKNNYGSGRCKRIFEKKYFIGKDRTDWQDYRDVFSKKMLKVQIKNNIELKKIYFIVRGKISKLRKIN